MAKKKTTAKKSSKKPVKKGKKVSSKKQISIQKLDFKQISKNIKSFNWEPVLKTVGLTLIILGSFIGVDLLIQYLNNDYSVAVVNGERVSKREYYKLLDQAYGESISETLIEYSLIRQEAKAEGIELSQEEVDEELQNTIDYVGGEESFEQLLATNGITRDDVIDQIELSLLTTKILTPTLEYTEDEVKEFFDEYSELIFPEETDALEEGELLDYDEYHEETEEVFINQQVEDMKSTWLTELKAEAKIQNNAVEKPEYGLLTVTRNIINNLIDTFNNNEVEE
jgi:hypothetical protein